MPLHGSWQYGLSVAGTSSAGKEQAWTSRHDSGILEGMAITVLKDTQAIERYLEDLANRRVNTIALDIEGEFNLHCYGEHLCLVQIFDGARDIIIDPQSFEKKTPLKLLFEKRDLLKIMYDSASDAALLHNVYGISIKSILDLRPAVSLLDYEKQHLSHVLSEELGIPPVKKKRFQRYNWMKRPIDQDALEYAMNDVRHLFALERKLFQKLSQMNLFDTYILQNLMIQNGTIKNNQTDRHKKAKGYSRLNRLEKIRFKMLFAVRDRFARQLNKPPHFVFNNAALLALSRTDVRAAEQIEKGMHRTFSASVKAGLLRELQSVWAEAGRIT